MATITSGDSLVSRVSKHRRLSLFHVARRMVVAGLESAVVEDPRLSGLAIETPLKRNSRRLTHIARRSTGK
jgi:hypothetical protein